MSNTEQLTTFYIGNDLFGIEVMKVQEISINPSIFPVPLSPRFVLGLVNLRGQIATALGMRELFMKEPGTINQPISVVCKLEGNLVSLIVDSIGEVVEVDKKLFERSPDTIPLNVRKFIKGIYKMNDVLISVLDIEMLARELSPVVDTSSIIN